MNIESVGLLIVIVVMIALAVIYIISSERRKRPVGGAPAGQHRPAAPPAERSRPESAANPRYAEELYAEAVRLFKQDKFQAAASLLEKAAAANSTSAAIRFTLGTTYLRIGGGCGGNEVTASTWLARGAEAFQQAIVLARAHGGLNEDQLAKATLAVASASGVQPQNRAPAAATWADVQARYGQYITRNFNDDDSYACEIQTFYPSRATADRVLSKVDQRLAGRLRCVMEGSSDLSGSMCFHVVHEGDLTGREFKEYLTTIVGAGGQVYEAFAR